MRLILLLLLALVVSPAAAAGWLRAEGPGFVAYSRGSEEDLRARLLKLQQFDALLRLMTGVEVAKDAPPLPVYFANGRDLPTFGLSDTGVGGFYRATPGNIVAVLAVDRAADFGNGVLTVLFHEYTHHFMFQHTRGAYPGWYVEGFAEYLATAKFTGPTIEYGAVDPGRGYQLVRNPWVPMATVFGPRQAMRGDATVHAFYAQSWLAVHYLARDDGRRSGLKTYLSALSAGTAPEAAFKTAFGTDYAGFDKQLRAYLLGRKMTKSRVTGLPAVKAGEIKVTQLPPSADGLLLPATQLASLSYRAAPGFVADADDEAADRKSAERNHRDQLARRDRLLATIRTAAARYPGDAFAERVRAEAEFKLGDRAAGAARLDALLAATPADPDLLAARGAMLLAEATGDADRKRARILLTKANARRPDDYRILAMHAMTFPDMAFPDTEVPVLLRAAELAPQVSEIQARAALMLARRGEKAEAKRMLAPIANNAHGGRAARAAAELIAAIDTGAIPATLPDVFVD